MKISAIISTYNRSQFLEGLFESILQQNIDTSYYEVVIVNNNSTDDTELKCRQFIAANPSIRIKYVKERQQGLSFGRNRGIKESEAEYLTFLDDDAVLTPNFMEETVTFLDAHPEVSAIGGKILLKYLCEKPSWSNPYMASLFGFFDKGDKSKQFTTDYFRGSNMSFRADLFQNYDAFNTKLGRVGRQLYGNEEKELFFRLQSGSEKMWYVPQAVVLHLVPVERTSPDFIKKQAIGTGISQRRHAQVQGKFQELFALLKEALKWVATFGLAFIYTLRMKFAVAKMLIFFRKWVSYGMLFHDSATKLL